MICRVLILSALTLSGGSIAQGADTAESAGSACSGGVREDTSIGATGERIVVSTIIQPGAANEGPVFDQTIRRQTGERILRVEARGLFDNAGPIACEDRLAAAQRQLMEEIQTAERLTLSDTGIMSLPVRMAQLSACLINEEACNREPHYVNPSDDLRKYGAEALDTLVAEEPLTFSVFITDCQRDTYLYDPESLTVLNVESTGC
ncbi:MAG: hypothetical protein AAF950_06100 [Pseudomonadota bacterium]